MRSKQQLVANLATHAEQVIDARAASAFRGPRRRSRGAGLRGGHIPGSRNVPYDELFDAATGAMKPLEELRAAFTGAGVELDAADRDELRLRRLRRGADARAVSARRARHRAL